MGSLKSSPAFASFYAVMRYKKPGMTRCRDLPATTPDTTILLGGNSMKQAVLTATALACLTLTACATATDSVAEAKSKMTSMASSGDVIADAKASFQEAAQAGCAWRDTGSMIADAEKLMADGKTDEANALASRAMRQAQIGMEQCANEEKHYSASLK
ncbi:MAG: hypothetical protein KDJ38_06835 [Gammaproteobacteria bacterium]|nr:hypothetical protein [Gammaproteobacteria bacterium]